MKNKEEVKSKNIWDFIKEVTQIQTPDLFKTLTEKEIAEFNPFLLTRFLGLNERLTELMAILDKEVARGISKEKFYKLLIKIIPKGSYWLNFKKSNIKNNPQWFLEIIQDYFIFISKGEAEFYSSLLTNQQKIILAKKYGISKEKLKELNE